MKIKSLSICNWRSIKNVDIEFQDLMIFIGQNNHGKSNILSALLFFFGQINADDLDYYMFSDALYVEITFNELSDDEKSTFAKYVTSFNTIKIRKSSAKSVGVSYNGYLEQPDIEWLKEENISDYTKREVAATLPLYKFLPTSGKIKIEDFKDAQIKYIDENKNDLQFSYVLESSSFMGWKNVVKGMLGEVYYVPSVKKASDELGVKGNSIFSQLYSRVILTMSENNPDYIDAKNKISSLTKVLNKVTNEGKPNTNRPKELSALEDNLEEELLSWQTIIDVEITPPNVEEIFKVGAKVWVNDGIKTDIERKGHGLQRAIIFALIKAWAKTLSVEKGQNSDEQSVEKKSSRKPSQSSYFIFEEPELYLHPQAQRELFNSLNKLTQNGNQVILCTHSGSFLDLRKHKSICIVRKDDISEGSKVLQCVEEIFTVEEEKKLFDMTYWINPDRSELFFAKKIILVEGPTEKTVIPLLAQSLGVFRYDYTLVDCGNKDAMPSYIKLLNKFSLKYAVVYDIDHQEDKTDEQKKCSDDKSKLIEDVINNEHGKSYTFANDIEEELGLYPKPKKDKPYKAVKYILSPEFLLKDNLKEKIISIFS